MTSSSPRPTIYNKNNSPDHRGNNNNNNNNNNKRKPRDARLTRKRRRPGRPLLSFAELAARKAARRAAHISRRQWKYLDLDADASETADSSALLFGKSRASHRNGSSTLETLPVELLERIFLYALEPNFCRASPYLASAVSSERIYRTLIRLAFFQDDSSSSMVAIKNANARMRIAEALKPADYSTMWLDNAERTHLQATVLRCRWCTNQRIQNQLPVLMQMAVQKHWVGANITLSDPEQQASLNNLLGLHNDENAIEDAPLASTVLFQGTATDGKTYYMSIIPLVSISINCAEANIRDVHRVLKVRVIPDYLLRGSRNTADKGWSFAEEDVDLLELFRHEYGFDGTGHDVRFSRDALLSGIRTAIATRNARALTTLLKTDEFFFRRRLETESQDSGQYYAIPQEIFLQAAELPIPDAMHFFKLLLRCNAESIPADSSEITQWAMELLSDTRDDDDLSVISDTEEDRKQSFGRWLLDFMIDLPGNVDEARENPREKALFYYGAINAQTHRMGRRFLDQVCAGMDITDRTEWTQSWMHKMTFDISKTWSG